MIWDLANDVLTGNGPKVVLISHLWWSSASLECVSRDVISERYGPRSVRCFRPQRRRGDRRRIDGWPWKRPFGSIGSARLDATFPRGSGVGTRCSRTSTGGRRLACGLSCSNVCSRSRLPPTTWIASYRSTRRSCASTSTVRPWRAPHGARSNYKMFGPEPADHAIGRSRGGLTTQTHRVRDGKGRPLAFIMTGGQIADTSMLIDTLDQIRVPGAAGRPRTRLVRVIADKGYPSRPIGPACANEASLPQPPNARTRSPTATSDRAGRLISATSSVTATAAATSSSAPSASSSNGAASRCVPTR